MSKQIVVPASKAKAQNFVYLGKIWNNTAKETEMPYMRISFNNAETLEADEVVLPAGCKLVAFTNKKRDGKQDADWVFGFEKPDTK